MTATTTAATTAARENQDRFQSLAPASLSRSEKSSVVKLALAVLSARYRPGRAFTSPEDIEGFLRLKLTGRRNEVFGIIYLDTRHRLIKIEELFNGMVYTFYHATCRPNEGIDRNAQIDFEQLTYLTWADIVVSNDERFFRLAFEAIWKPRGKRLETAESFAELANRIA